LKQNVYKKQGIYCYNIVGAHLKCGAVTLFLLIIPLAERLVAQSVLCVRIFYGFFWIMESCELSFLLLLSLALYSDPLATNYFFIFPPTNVIIRNFQIVPHFLQVHSCPVCFQWRI